MMETQEINVGDLFTDESGIVYMRVSNRKLDGEHIQPEYDGCVCAVELTGGRRPGECTAMGCEYEVEPVRAVMVTAGRIGTRVEHA